MTTDSFPKSDTDARGNLIRSAVEEARSALAAGVTAASLGVFTGYWVGRRRSAATAVAFGIAGAMIGFTAAMAWGTRRVTGEIARGTIKKLHATRDARWLAHHPIDYA